MIGRAGASTVCELAVAGRPSILVPLKIAVDDHQRFNARLLADAGAAQVVNEDELTVDSLAELLQAMLSDPAAPGPHGRRRPRRGDAGRGLEAGGPGGADGALADPSRGWRRMG